MVKEETKGWFDCLNAVAIEIEPDKSETAFQTLVNVMDGAGITLEEVRWAQEQHYITLDECNVLITYEGILMEREEELEHF